MIKAKHLIDRKSSLDRKKAICQKNLYEYLDCITEAEFILAYLAREKCCSHCLKRISRNTDLIKIVPPRLPSEEEMGMFLLSVCELGND